MDINEIIELKNISKFLSWQKEEEKQRERKIKKIT
jgi:hypothetical protein